MQRQKSFETKQPTLYLVATPIGNLEEMTYRAIRILNEVDYIGAEDTRNTIKLLNHFDIKTKLMSHHEHNWKQSIPKFIELLKEGKSIALVSDAGYPAISDPGYELVMACIDNDIAVVPVSGCNACLDALVVSGITPQPFTFYGFLDRLDKIKRQQLEALKNHQETLIFYESPHRIKKTLKLLLEVFGDRSMALCREITKKHEEIIRGHISEVLDVCDELKGEMVVVVEGNHEVVEEEQPLDIEALLKEKIALGMTSKDAIKDVSKQYHLKKNDVYDIYLKMEA